MSSIGSVWTGEKITQRGSIAQAGASLAMDTQNEGVACVFTQPVDDTITHVHFRCSTNTLVPADDSYTASLQSVDSSGNPGGVLGGGSPASVTFPNATYPEASFGSGTGHWLALGNSIAVQGGTDYAVVVQKTGATDLSNLLTISSGDTGFDVLAKPYALHADATPTWTKQSGTPYYFAVKSASAVYLHPHSATPATSATFGNTAELGFTFVAPAGLGISNTISLRSVFLPIGTTGIAAGGTWTGTLYSGSLAASPTIIQQALQVDSDHNSTAANRGFTMAFPEDTLAALVPGTKYAFAMSHSGATSGSLRYNTLTDAADNSAWNLGGLLYCTRTITYPPDGADANAFAETTTRIVLAALEFTEFVAAAGGGGGGQRVIGG